MIEISQVDLREEETALVLEVLRSGRLAQGPMVERFEEVFAVVAGTEFAVAVSSGTTALVAALQALEVRAGEEVITSPFTFAATLNAILETGATARLVDITDDFTISPAAVKAAINDRTVAIMPVHLYGLPADMAAIASLAGETGLAVVEDAAQAHGATVDGRPAGSFGVGCFSFYATKNITTGEGGVITTDDAAVADRLRLLRSQGMRERYQYEIPGHNYRMTELQAAIGIPQVGRLEQLNAQRRRNAAMLDERLAGVEAVRTPTVPAGRVHVYHQYTVELAEGLDRDAVVDSMAEAGVRAGVYYPRLAHDHACYDLPSVVADDLDRARSAARSVLSLPVHPGLGEQEIDAVASSLVAVVDR